jgi:hypothetical protein
MFNTVGLFGDIPCPVRDSCDRSFCLFSHDTNAIFNSTRVDPLILPPKRRIEPDTLVQSPAERPTKLQRAGSTAKPLAIPTASSSPVSSTSLPSSHYRFFIVPVDWRSYPYNQCRAVKGPRFDSPGKSLPMCMPQSCCYVSSALLSLVLPALHAHTLPSSSTHFRQDHVEIVIRSLRRSLRVYSPSKPLVSVRSYAPSRARDIRAHDKVNLSKCDHFHLVLAVPGSLISSDRHYVYCLSQETPCTDLPQSPLCRHFWRPRSSARRGGRSVQSTPDTIQTRPLAPHP